MLFKTGVISPSMGSAFNLLVAVFLLAYFAQSLLAQKLREIALHDFL
jgi:hypothetical protein